mmetsp:Transcript_5796/g.9925  ORF Transcript_5796/g.9925 Transcript_5796/m.9925 type:complete len:150 (-) Transcript_5796:316-765(-)
MSIDNFDEGNDENFEDGDEDAEKDGNHGGSDDDKYEEDEDEDDDSEEEDHATSRRHKKVQDKRKSVLKPKAGGVNGGRDKKHSNGNQTRSGGERGLSRKVNIQTSANDADLKKRTKERTITEIIEKVSTWRKLYNGVMIPNKVTGELQL